MPQMFSPIRAKGFTLIELSIVLVIIGLLAAGILVGRDLIHAAEIRREVSQIEKMDTAVMTFRGKYNCIPGDCPNAEDYGLGVTGGDGENGDGDGKIDYLSTDPLDSEEAQHFWHHLGAANLIDGTYVAGNIPGVNTPALKMAGKGLAESKGGFWISSLVAFLYPGAGPMNNVWLLTSTTSTAQPAGVYDPTTAFAIDNKIDDGKPITGKMSVAAGSGNAFIADNEVNVSIYSTHNVQPAQQFPDACVDDVDPLNPTYNLANEDANAASVQSLCMPIIKAVF